MKGHIFANDLGTWFLACVRCGESTFAEPSYKRRLCRRVPFLVDEIVETHFEDENVHRHWVMVRIGATMVRVDGSGVARHPLPTKVGDEIRLSHRDCRNYHLQIPKSCARPRAGKGKLFKKRWRGVNNRRFWKTFGFEKVDQPHGVWWTPNRHSIGRCPGEPSEYMRQVFEREGSRLGPQHAAWLESQRLDRCAIRQGVIMASHCSSTHAEGVVCPVCEHTGEGVYTTRPDGTSVPVTGTLADGSEAPLMRPTTRLVKPAPLTKKGFVSRRARTDHLLRVCIYEQVVAQLAAHVEQAARIKPSNAGVLGLFGLLHGRIDDELAEAALAGLRLDRESAEVIRQAMMPKRWGGIGALLDGWLALLKNNLFVRRQRKKKRRSKNNSGKRRSGRSK